MSSDRSCSSATWSGSRPGEIADRMGRSEGSIHGLHHRGRRALQQELQRLDSTPYTRRSQELAAA